MSTETPEDVMDAARQAASDLDDIHFNSRSLSWVEDARDIVAKVIMAERERAALLADNLAKHAKEARGGKMSDADMCWYSVEKQAEALAAAIRGSKP